MFINHLLNGMILGFLNKKSFVHLDIWKMIQFDEHIFHRGWFDHQLDCLCGGCFLGGAIWGWRFRGKRDFEGIWAHLTKKHGVCWCLLYIRCLMHEYFGAANCFGNDEKASWYRGLIDVHHFSGTFLFVITREKWGTWGILSYNVYTLRI